MAIFKHDEWAFLIVSQLLQVVVADSSDDANVDNLFNEEGADFQKSMYTNKRIVENLKVLLPWLDNRGAFDV